MPPKKTKKAPVKKKKAPAKKKAAGKKKAPARKPRAKLLSFDASAIEPTQGGVKANGPAQIKGQRDLAALRGAP